MRYQKIIIVGFMGSGKSSVAAAIGRRSNVAVIDLDDKVTKTHGRTPGDIIELDGELSFRKIETRVLREALQQQGPRAIALGGGAWTIPENRKVISEQDATLTVWLDAPLELCWKRIIRTTEKRPLAPTMEAAETLYRERASDYALADKTIRVSENESAEDIAARIADLVESDDDDQAGVGFV